MALQGVLALLGVLELLVPKRVVDAWMALAVKGDDVELRDWVYTAARLEGALILLWAVRGRGGD